MEIYNEKLGIVTKIVDNETVKVKVINSNKIKEIKGNKFYIAELREAYENTTNESEGIVIIKFNEFTNRLIEESKEGNI
ncbi:TPA: hypothetical protein LA462_000317 [Clostridium botulinum]|nr:hypothetical protein [Clostridium botulinum]